MFIHPGSILFFETKFNSRWAVFLSKSRTETKILLRDCNEAPTSGILLFCGEIQVKHEAGIVLVDGWIPILSPARTAVLAKELRTRLDTLLHAKFEDPLLSLASSPLLKAFQDLIIDN